MKIFSSLFLILFFNAGCAEQSDFHSHVSAGRASFEISHKDLIAQEMLSTQAFNKKMIVTLDNEKSFLPAGGKFIPGSNMLEWQSDLQDIGKSLEGQLIPSGSNSQDALRYTLRVNAPVVQRNSCSTGLDPVIGDIKPVLKWHWKGFEDNLLTFSAPVVGDLDRNGSVEIVTTISTKNGWNENNAPLVVLSGSTGELLWNSQKDSGIVVEASTTPSLIDLDGDGVSEIIIATMDGVAPRRKLLILDYQQKSIRKTFNDGFICGRSCLSAVGDIDGDGKAEIIAGNVILDHQGLMKARLTPTPDLYYEANTSTIADLVPESPGLEIISNGSQVYSNRGILLWKGKCKGFSAVADLNDDGTPELVCSGSGSLSVYSNTGQKLWEQEILGGGNGGAPNVGRFITGNEMQIGIAGGAKYQVYDKDGNILWAKETQDLSSSSTGSTIFDFNGDGKVEVIYNDETQLRIYAGDNGDVLWSVPNISGTLWEYPVIADIDNDNSADLIVSAPGWHSSAVPSPGQGGIKVFHDPSKKWMKTRKVWNQYSYYPELVSENLSPVRDPGLPTRGFRTNHQGQLTADGKTLLPDLSIITPFFPNDLSGGAELSFYVINHGEKAFDPDFNFQLMDLETGEVLANRESPGELPSGEGKLFTVTVDPKRLGKDRLLRVTVNKGANGNLIEPECQGENNKKDFKLLRLDRRSL